MQTQRTCKCQEGFCQASEAYLGQLDEHFKYSLPKGGKVAGFFAESIQVQKKKEGPMADLSLQKGQMPIFQKCTQRTWRKAPFVQCCPMKFSSAAADAPF